MTLSNGIFFLLNTADVTDHLATLPDTRKALFSGRPPEEVNQYFPNVCIFEVRQDARFIGAPLYQVSIRTQGDNAESKAEEITDAVLRQLDYYQGSIGTEALGYVAINSCVYQPGGQNLVEDGGVIHRPLSFLIATNKV